MESFENMPLVFSGIAFVALCLFFVGVFNALKNYAMRTRMIEKIRTEGLHPYPAGFAGQTRESGNAGSSFLDFFQAIGRKVGPDAPEEYTRMRLRFYRAGIRNPNAPSVLWGAKAFSMTLLSVGFFLLHLVVTDQFHFQVSMTGVVLFAVLGFYLPDMALHFVTARRKRIMFEGFPDALDLLVICVEAGMGLDAALARVGQEIKMSNKALSDELTFLNLEIRAGKTREEALRNLAVRTDIDDVQHLATLLIQTDRFGTSVARALRVFSDTFRTKRFQRAEEIAAKLPVKMVFPVTVFIFPALFVVIAGPAAIRVYQTFLQ